MRILLIEDEQSLAESLVEGLTASRYVVDHLTHGSAAIDRLMVHRNEYDVVILDLALPDVDGDEVCETVRAKGVTIPILVLTARGETEDKVKLLKSGADDYMVKPFAFDELEARIQALLRRPEDTMPDVLAVGHFTLNSGTRQIFRFGTPLQLTLKEFMLLEYLMRHRERVISRDEIIDHAWNFDFDSFSNTVDVHVKNVRKKIGSDGEHIIKTVRGVGYQFVE